MANYAIKLDLKKIQGTFVTKIAGKTQTKTCICIPTDSAGIFLGEKGCYLSMTALEMREPKYNDTHCIKADIPKERREAMTEEQRNAVPILGGLHAMETQQQATTQVGSTPNQEDLAPTEDLPF